VIGMGYDRNSNWDYSEAGALRWLAEAEASASAHDPLLVAINLATPRAPR
jgi:hypothetical protein